VKPNPVKPNRSSNVSACDLKRAGDANDVEVVHLVPELPDRVIDPELGKHRRALRLAP
jgi:hypothetical protein